MAKVKIARPRGRPRAILNVREAASLLRVSPKAVYSAARSGKLPGYKFGDRGGWRFPLAAILAGPKPEAAASVQAAAVPYVPAAEKLGVAERPKVRRVSAGNKTGVLTLGEWAERVGVGKWTLYDAARAGALKADKVKREVMTARGHTQRAWTMVATEKAVNEYLGRAGVGIDQEGKKRLW